jgi:hypothetical protein
MDIPGGFAIYTPEAIRHKHPRRENFVLTVVL